MQITVVARPETNEVAILTTMATAHIGLQPQDALELADAIQRSVLYIAKPDGKAPN